MTWSTRVAGRPAWLRDRGDTRFYVLISTSLNVVLATLLLYSWFGADSSHCPPKEDAPFHNRPQTGDLPTSQPERENRTILNLALASILQDASPVFGHYLDRQTSTSTWMKQYPDTTRLIHMNLPGTHDTSTWNYSLATQQALLHVTNLGDGLPQTDSRNWRCQQRPVVDMLDAGIRAFDLRYAFDVTNSTLVFWHGGALQSQTATVADVMYAYYAWLDDHPSEVILLSFQYEGATTRYAANGADVQLALYNVLTSPAAKRYLLPRRDSLGTLGEARGKIVLLRRFDLDKLPAEHTGSLPGLHFPPAAWTVNGLSTIIVYNAADNLTAYIEDYYEIDAPKGSDAATAIRYKYNATTTHLSKASSPQHRDDLFWTFVSSEYIMNDPPDYPRIMALGNGTNLTTLGGVNHRLLPFLKQQIGKRLGIVMFDFYDEPEELINTFLSLQMEDGLVSI